jgi:serine/threonine protein phosphatase PrpC
VLPRVPEAAIPIRSHPLKGMILNIDRYKWFGASVRGPHHSTLHEPNQDAWSGKMYKTYALITVCDGLGSRKNSKIGAAKACKAVTQAVHAWMKCSNVPIQTLLRLVKLFWEMNISPLNPSECATTCLFAVLISDNRLIIGGLGDGIAAIRHSDGQVIKAVDRGEAFLNHTLALGDPHKLDDWKLIDFKEYQPGDIVMLASDGIADDLVDERIPDLMNWLVKEYGSMAPKERTSALRKELINWPTSSHQDDKTIALLYYTNGDTNNV